MHKLRFKEIILKPILLNTLNEVAIVEIRYIYMKCSKLSFNSNMAIYV